MRKIFMFIAAYALLLGAGRASAECFERFPAGADIADETLVDGLLDFNRDGKPDAPFVAIGPMTIQRGQPFDPGDGKCEIDTEMTLMNMQGTFTDPTGFSRDFTLTTHRDKKVTGKIKQQVAGQDFPADSHLDLFVELVVPINPFIVERPFNQVSARLQGPINCIPPREEETARVDGPIRLTSNLSGLPYADLLQIIHRPFFDQPDPPLC